MSAPSSILWNNDDVLEAKLNPSYPFITYTWGSQEAIDQGVGVMKSVIGINGVDESYWVATPVPAIYSQSLLEPSLMDMSIWANLFQLALSLPGGADLKVFSDNVTCSSSPNLDNPDCDLFNVDQGLCPIRSYLTSMLRKTSFVYEGTTSTDKRRFSYDRFLLRTIPPPPMLNTTSSPASNTGMSVPLPLRYYKNDSCLNSPLIIWGVIPPLGYKNTGAFIERTTDDTSSPANLLFIRDDPRFCQPPSLGIWDVSTINAWGYFLSQYFTLKVSSKVPSQTTAGQTTSKEATYRYLSLTNLILNKLVWDIFPVVPGQQNFKNRNTYASVLPWAVNAQLFRYFPNAPEKFDGITAPQRTKFNANNNCGITHESSKQLYLHLLAANPLVHPVGPRYGQGKNPLMIPMSFYNVLDCCNGLYQHTSFFWDPFATTNAPMPSGTVGLPAGTSLGQVICMAGEWAWKMEPNGITCDSLALAVCNPSSPYWAGPWTDPAIPFTCACANKDRMIQEIFGSPPPKGWSAQEKIAIQNLQAGIQCFYDACYSDARAVKNSNLAPYAYACPSTTTCIIQQISLETGNLSPVTVINNCGGGAENADGDGGQNDWSPLNPRGGEVGTIGVALAVASVFVILIVLFVILLLRRRKSRRTEERELREAAERRELREERAEEAQEAREAREAKEAREERRERRERQEREDRERRAEAQPRTASRTATTKITKTRQVQPQRKSRPQPRPQPKPQTRRRDYGEDPDDDFEETSEDDDY